jgi:hypothetical protein
MHLLNRKAVRSFILGQVRALRPGMEMDRVSKGVIDFYETRLRTWIEDDVRRHPSKGKTFMEVASRLNGAYPVLPPRK